MRYKEKVMQDLIVDILVHFFSYITKVFGRLIPNYQYDSEETSKMMLLLVAWKIEYCRMYKEKIILVEYDDELILNEDKLVQLYNKIKNIPASFDQGTWFICDNMVLKVACNFPYKRLELKITISRGVEDWNIKSALRVDPERQVSSLMVIYSY
jgi:hypothetical protein